VQELQPGDRQIKTEEANVQAPVVEINVTHHCVYVEGQRVNRPCGIAVSAWMEFWEDVKRGTYKKGYAAGYSDGEDHGREDRFS
jgi:hypothetical protein